MVKFTVKSPAIAVLSFQKIHFYINFYPKIYLIILSLSLKLNKPYFQKWCCPNLEIDLCWTEAAVFMIIVGWAEGNSVSP